MRVPWTFFAVLLLAFAIFSYFQWAEDSEKLPDELDSATATVSSEAQHSEAASPLPVAPAPSEQPTTTVPAPAAAVSTPPAPPPPKPWAPPDVMPAQPNWTWETLDGKTYQNVVVTKIEPTTVSITHSLGAGHIPINLLPPDIQKKLNYDPVAAAAAQAESQREETHPYYTMASLAEAQSLARQLHRPLAWMCSQRADLDNANPQPGSEEDLTQMALNDLKSRTVVIFLDGNADLPALSPIIRDQQFFQLDDGPLPGGHHFYGPKVVFSDANITKAFGRVSHTQMVASREAAIETVLAAIPPDPNASSAPKAQMVSAPAPASSSPTAVPILATSPSAPATTVTPTPPVAAAPPSPDAPKVWAPPDVMPAQPNWTWETLDGKTYQNVVVTKIEPTTVSITHSLGAGHIPINLLPPDIQKRLNYDPHAAAEIPGLIADKLVSADGTATDAPGTSVQYYAIYYSAQWCPPCHAFTPRLVQWYNKFKPGHPNFELIFVSEDHDETAMLNYMKEMAMPWPAVRFDQLLHDGNNTFKGSGIEKFAGDGIPDLVLVDAGGKVLADSYQDGTYIGPEAVVDNINKLIGGTSPVSLARQIPVAPAAKPTLISVQNSSTARGVPAGT